MAGFIPAIHVFHRTSKKDVEARHKAGHDDLRCTNKNEQAIQVSPNRLLVEDLTAFGYPRPAPLLAAGDHVFFDDTIPGPANRSVVH